MTSLITATFLAMGVIAMPAQEAGHAHLALREVRPSTAEGVPSSVSAQPLASVVGKAPATTATKAGGKQFLAYWSM